MFEESFRTLPLPTWDLLNTHTNILVVQFPFCYGKSVCYMRINSTCECLRMRCTYNRLLLESCATRLHPDYSICSDRHDEMTLTTESALNFLLKASFTIWTFSVLVNILRKWVFRVTSGQRNVVISADFDLDSIPSSFKSLDSSLTFRLSGTSAPAHLTKD